jgi:hypothetical protein
LDRKKKRKIRRRVRDACGGGCCGGIVVAASGSALCHFFVLVSVIDHDGLEVIGNQEVVSWARICCTEVGGEACVRLRKA